MVTTNPTATVDQSGEQIEQLDDAIRARRCLRCGGSLFPNRFNGPGEWACLQCGRTYRRVPPAGQPSGVRRPTRWTA